VFFDQRGILSRKFNLKYLPVKIVSEGDKLRIQEYSASEYQVYEPKEENL